jgi:integrase
MAKRRKREEYDTLTKSARVGDGRRGGLPARPKPYFRKMGAGKALGYIRRSAGPGSWIVREGIGGQYRTRVIGLADDFGPADGRDVLTYQQAAQKATEPDLPLSVSGRLTVADAMDTYLAMLEAKSAHAKETRQRADLHIIPKLGTTRVDRLTKTQIEKWRDGMIRGNPDPDKPGDLGDPEAKRRSQDSANRILTILKAALNHAFADDANKIATDAAWRRVKPFKSVAGARVDHFDADQVRSLIGKAAEFDQAFANLLEAGFLTGARLGELAALAVRDFDAERSTLAIGKGKTGARVVTLTAESVAFFGRLTKDRPAGAVLLPRADGDRWGKSEQARPFKRAAAAAELPATASFYTLRHSHISRAIEAGMPLSLLAENCGTSLGMIQKNYAKVLASTRRQFVESTSPRLRVVK